MGIEIWKPENKAFSFYLGKRSLLNVEIHSHQYGHYLVSILFYKRIMPTFTSHKYRKVSIISPPAISPPLTSPLPPLISPPVIGPYTCEHKSTSGYKPSEYQPCHPPPLPSPQLACIEMKSIFYDVKKYFDQHCLITCYETLFFVWL